MKNLSRWFMLAMLVAAFGLFGCEGDDGKDGQDFQLPQGENVGLVNCTACHAGTATVEDYAQSAHLNQGSHTINSCATACHNPLGDAAESNAAFGVSSPSVVGCESCHGPGSSHFGVGEIPIPVPDTAVCGQCHDAVGDLAHLTHHPFNELITSRFLAGPHGGENGDNHARDGFCSACHSHEGALAFFELGGAEDVLDLANKFNPLTVPSYAKTEEELVLRECATCHDPHTGNLRADDTIMDVTADWDYNSATVDTTVTDVTVFSAEFNLCTTCHMVDLAYLPGDEGDKLLSYELDSGSYSADNMVDAATGTFNEVGFDIFEPDGSIRSDRTVYNSQIFYHDNTPGGGRSFVDTHFAGTVVGRVAAVDETNPADAVKDVMLTGYNVNAAAVDACTTCHDPHSANKVQGDDLDVAVAAGEGVGMFHADYLGSALGRNCTPCHDGGEAFVTWLVGGGFPERGDSMTRTIACRTCHQLEQFDATAEEMLGDPTAVREFAADHVFAFPGYVAGEMEHSGGVEVAVADLGVNQICFECHKGRNSVKDTADTTTRAYDVSYLHYAASFATLFGDGYNMVPTYNSAIYNGRFQHGGGAVGTGSAAFGCADCHDVHDTDGNDVASSKMTTAAECVGCHGPGALAPADVLRDRTVAYGAALRDTIVDEFNTRANAIPVYGTSITVADFSDIQSGRNADSEIGANDLAYATAIYRVFNYDDGSPVGTEHGHGGSWAHNSLFARQVQYDAIEDLGDPLGLLAPANPTGLVRP